MGKLIYWKEYDEPIKVVDAKTLEEREVTGDWHCEDERVQRCWIIVSHPPTDLDKEYLQYMLILLFKDGDRKDFKSEKFPKHGEQDLSSIISQAEQYLQSIKKENEFGDITIKGQ